MANPTIEDVITYAICSMSGSQLGDPDKDRASRETAKQVMYNLKAYGYQIKKEILVTP